MIDSNPSAVQIAKKKRHLHLLQKVKDSKALTAAELRELDGYEAERQKAEAKTSSAKAAHGKRGKAARIAEAEVREAAFECESFDQAAERLGVADLQKLLDGKPKLAAAFERGRFLREVRRVAGKGIVAEEADRFFEPALGRGELVDKIAKDRILADVWRTAHAEAKQQAREGLMRLARSGDAKAMALYEQLLLEPPAGGELDWQDLTSTQLEGATGIKRAQWLRWVKDFRCPRKASGRYSLPAVIAWLREHESTGGVKLNRGLNPMQVEKARMYKLQADEAEGRLIARDIVVRLFTARAARMVQILSEARAKDWAAAHEGHTAAQLEAEYLEAFRSLRLLWKDFPEEIPLPPVARAKIEEGIRLLMREGTTDESG